MFPGLYHLSALMHEGLTIWDAANNCKYCTCMYLVFVTADCEGMTYLNSLVLHRGAPIFTYRPSHSYSISSIPNKNGCHVYYLIVSRNKPRTGQHYPACKQPRNSNARSANHPDFNLNEPLDHKEATARYRHKLKQVMCSRTQTEYKKNPLETSIAKPSIFSGLPSGCHLGIPRMFLADIIHLVSLNLPELLIPLWCDTLSCDSEANNKSMWDWAVLVGEIWKQHGAAVAATLLHLPGSFDRSSRNPVEKINSGYNAWVRHSCTAYCQTSTGVTSANLCGASA